MRPESSDLMMAMRLLDQLKLRGFEFRRTAPGEDGPLVGHRVSGDWVDIVRVEGFSCNCLARRERLSSLVTPRNCRAERQVEGRALDVFNEVLTWDTGS